jgi:hypothetical protein
MIYKKYCLINSAIIEACISKAKWPVSNRATCVFGLSFLNFSAPSGIKDGLFLPQTASNFG